MPGELSEAELAERAGTTPERIRQLVELGLVESSDGRFSRRDLMRVRVVNALEGIGLEVDALASGLASGHLSLGYLESAGRRHPRADRTFSSVAEEIGVPFAMLERLYTAFGLVRPTPDELVREEDLEALRILPVLIGAGVEERDVLAIARVWGDSARRTTEYLSHYFDTAIRDVGIRIGRSGEDLLGWLFRRHSEVYLTEHQFDHVETALEEAGVRRRPPRQPEAAVFADLAGYTRLTEESGDDAAARVAIRLAALVNEVASRHRGSVVKLLGDGVYLHFRDPADAVRASLELVAAAPGRDLPPVHIGINAGPMLYDEGGHFGRTVNIAARIASVAGAGQVLVGESVAEGIAAKDFRFADAGSHELKGIAQPVRVLEAL